MKSIDTNLLLYALNPSAKEHDSAMKFIESWSSSTDVVIIELVLVELYQLLRNPRVFQQAASAQEATRVIQSFRRNPKWQIVENAPVMDEVWRIASEDDFARRRLFDVRLALTLQHHGVTHFATANVKDFQNLGFEKVWNPLLEK